MLTARLKWSGMLERDGKLDGCDADIVWGRVRHLLRFAYAHVQLVLYRPFLHYISPRLNHGGVVNEICYACAAAAISVARNIVHIGLEIRKQGVLSGPYWFMLYTEFFAVLSLVFYAIENQDKAGAQEVLADARAGRQMIADLADKTMTADRVTKALQVRNGVVGFLIIPGRFVGSGTPGLEGFGDCAREVYYQG